jgi:hypothetical protein
VDVDGVPTAGLNVAANYVEPTSNVKNEIGFKILEASIVGGVVGAYAPTLDASGNPVTVRANVTTWSGADPAKAYRVLAYNVAGDSVPGASHVVQAAPGIPAAAVGPTAAPALTGPAGPTGLTQVLNASGTFTLSWTGIAGATGYIVSTIETPAPVLGVAQAALPAVNVTVPATPTTYTTPLTGAGSLNAGSTYTFSVAATTLSGTTAGTTVAGGLTNSQTADPVAFIGAAGAPGTISLTWANNPANKNNVANLNLTWTGGPAGSKTFPANSTGVTLIGLTKGVSYSFTLQALSNVTTFNSGIVALPAAITAP